MKESEIVILDEGLKDSDDNPTCWWCTGWLI
jgi:hypothetical protein